MTQPNDTYELPEDLFGREAIAEKIKGLLESDIDLSPMVIDGDWGIGKTVFCHRLINKINESQQLNCVYIDAFRADHIDDPLISIISEIGKLVEKNGGEGKLDSFIDGAKPFLRTAAKTLGKAALSYTIRQSTDDIAKDYEKEIEAVAGVSIDASIDLIIRDKINAEKNLDTLHEALKEVTKEKELVILIDELDRCRATFAIDLLETIKHAFSIPKVKILIIANSAQLETSFRHRYGSNNETKNYLEKFYNVKISLPTEENYNIFSVDFFISKVKSSDIITDSFADNALFIEGINELSVIKDLSLRDMNHLIKNIEICYILGGSSHFQSYKDIKKFIATLSVYIYTTNKKILYYLINESNREDVIIFFNLSLEDVIGNRRKKLINNIIFLSFQSDERTQKEREDLFNLYQLRESYEITRIYEDIYKSLEFKYK
jgi:DNA polymerase III delta prime subunit